MLTYERIAVRTLRIGWITALVVLALAGCADRSASGPVPAGAQPTVTEPLVVESEPTPCTLSPVVVPTPPAEVPRYTELDPTTGLHMTGSVPDIDFATYRLEVSGKVDNPLSLTYDDLRCMPKIEVECTLVCVGFFEDHATWAGAPLGYVLDLAGVQEGAENLRLVSADGYATLVSLESARQEDSFLAYEWEGEPLPILHGFPVRAVFPSLNGGDWVKWLIAIEVS
jgi:DMSO/TMAO reductase YedYZ molybdopterin-dependent catalytic subunit